MIHLRVVSPSDLTEKTIALLAGDPGVLNLVVLPGRVRYADGDAIECDVLNGTANTVLPSLRRLQVDRRGSIVIEPVELAISGRAADVETQQLGALANAPVWEEVEARIRADGTYTPSFYLFLIIAGVIGGVGILTNSQTSSSRRWSSAPSTGRSRASRWGWTGTPGRRSGKGWPR